MHDLLSNEKEDDMIHDVQDFTLADITNTIGMPRKSFYDTVYGSDESSDEDQPLATLLLLLLKTKLSSLKTFIQQILKKEYTYWLK